MLKKGLIPLGVVKLIFLRVCFDFKLQQAMIFHSLLCVEQGSSTG
jgi:hypothetical protein